MKVGKPCELQLKVFSRADHH